MDTWILQMNYPLVTVIQDRERHDTLCVRQERYLTDPNATDPENYESPYNYSWTIPLTFSSSQTLKFNHTKTDVYWLDKDLESAHFTLGDNELPRTDGWILANVRQYGYYRVNYELSNWDALIRQLMEDYQVIHVINRAQIIDDAWALAESGHLPIRYALRTLKFINRDTAYVVWSTAEIQIERLGKLLSETPAYGAFKSFMKYKLAAPLEVLGMSNAGSSHTDIRAREIVVKLACVFGMRECVERAQEQFREWVADPGHNPIDIELRKTFYCAAIKEGGWEEWRFLLKVGDLM
ncbi:aminopeptidase n [Plakobranchus ocellatus]|uniref:Aminopeptidase n n=1 Tax=Plakobranchus ocellatus TaxID=259542 RepID=A0AAV3ZTF4_9GAST|nr:aminopeptidase n [Plakobranchus ocellatus]